MLVHSPSGGKKVWVDEEEHLDLKVVRESAEIFLTWENGKYHVLMSSC